MKATYNDNYITIQGTIKETAKIDNVTNKLIALGYEDTHCGGDDIDNNEYWVMLKTFCTVKEARDDYKKSK